MERPVAKRRRNGIGVVPKHNNHLVADGTNGIIRRGNERLLTAGGMPR
jgi:hypothetical protein